MGERGLTQRLHVVEVCEEGGECKSFDYSGNVDSNYAKSLDDRRSVAGSVNFFAFDPVTRQSKTGKRAIL